MTETIIVCVFVYITIGTVVALIFSEHVDVEVAGFISAGIFWPVVAAACLPVILGYLIYDTFEGIIW